jgi:diguanylate cyclase (GGDEF)-like protein
MPDEKLPHIPRISDDDGTGEDTKLLSIAPQSAPSRRDAPYLVVVAGANAGETFRISLPELVLGRAPNVAIRVLDDNASRRHARLFRSGQDLIIEDLGSANGTLVNGEKITRSVLKDGDKIGIGSTTILKFTYTDIIDEAFQQRMYEAALRDGLTKAYNRKYLNDRLPTEVTFARRHRVDLTLLIVDIDHFKRVNDTLGHLAGDAVLSAVAGVLQGALRSEDVLTRYGGEEFAVLCRDTSPEQAVVIAERLRVGVESAPIAFDGKSVPVTISAGVGSRSLGADTPEELVAMADQALYEAKRSGRNRVCVGKRASSSG